MFGQLLGELPGWVMPALQAPIRVGWHEGDDVCCRRRHDLDHDLDRSRGKPAQPALLPADDEGPKSNVVVDSRPGARECESPACAFATAAHRPGRRRAAALAKRWSDPRQVSQAAVAELRAAHRADDAALRQEQVEHDLNLRRVQSRICQERITLVKLLPLRGQLRRQS